MVGITKYIWMSELNFCKSGGEEMASVLFSNIEEGMCSLIIDGEEFIEEEGRAVMHKPYIAAVAD